MFNFKYIQRYYVLEEILQFSCLVVLHVEETLRGSGIDNTKTSLTKVVLCIYYRKRFPTLHNY